MGQLASNQNGAFCFIVSQMSEALNYEKLMIREMQIFVIKVRLVQASQKVVGSNPGADKGFFSHVVILIDWDCQGFSPTFWYKWELYYELFVLVVNDP